MRIGNHSSGFVLAAVSAAVDVAAHVFRRSLSWLTVLVLAAFASSCTPESTLLSSSSALVENVCPDGTLYNPYLESCAPVSDLGSIVDRLSAKNLVLPNLLELRKRQTAKLLEAGTVPPPNGIGAGTTFPIGTLRAVDEGELHTRVFVHPGGIEPSNFNLTWLFSTATNRTEKGVEVVAGYYQDQPGTLGIFDWSCSPEDPCEGGHIGPAWIWASPVTDFTCNVTDVIDAGSHIQTIMQYANETVKLDEGDPPLWRNAVYLWNFCSGDWDQVYQHEYRTVQKDCSLYWNECGWWGPILETFVEDSSPLPEINEVGFEESLLLHDGVWSHLLPDETGFTEPASPWILFHLDPNRGYGAGNNFVWSVRVVQIDIKPGSYPNSVICTRDRGVIPVALLSTGDFDATMVDLSTITFEGASEIHVNSLTGEPRRHLRDVDDDGDVDLVFHFNRGDTDLTCASTEGTLRGQTIDGQELQGTDAIHMIRGELSRR